MLNTVSLMTWEEVECVDKNSPFILPISALEQHGHHLPLGADDLILFYILEGIKKNDLLTSEFYLLPTIHYGNSSEHLDFTGTVSLSASAIIEIIESIISSLKIHDFRKLVILNSHGGNSAILQGMAQEWSRKYDIKIYNIDLWGTDFFKDIENIIDTPIEQDIHAGEIETSILKFCCNNNVRTEEIREEKDVFFEIPPFYNSWNTLDISITGVLGGASMGCKEKGKKIYNYSINKIVDYLLAVCDT